MKRTRVPKRKHEWDPEWHHRCALRLMRDLSVNGTDQLIGMLLDKGQELDVRCDSAAALGHLALEKAQAPLIRAKREGLARLTRVADNALEEIRNKVLWEIEVSRQQQMLKSMSDLGVNSNQELIKIVSENTQPIKRRRTACAGLGQLGLVEAILPLVNVLEESKDLKLVWAAAHSLNAIRSRRATPYLISIVQNATYEQSREAAIYVLWFVGDARAVPQLISIIENHRIVEHTRAMAVEALGGASRRGRRFHKKALEVLLHASEDHSVEVRISAICALSGSTSRRARQAIQKRLGDKGFLQGSGTVGDHAREILAPARETLSRYSEFSLSPV